MHDRGYFVAPTVFADVQDDMKISRQEIFGPVMSVSKFADLDEVRENFEMSCDTFFPCFFLFCFVFCQGYFPR